MKAHTFTLLYGRDHFGLHKRLIDSFHRAMPDEMVFHVVLNEVGPDSAKLVEGLRERFAGVHLYTTEKNTPKYDLMRSMFQPFKDQDMGVDWIVWFDDDSHIVDDAWWPRTTAWLADRPDAVYAGQPWFVDWRGGQASFIQEASWYRGEPPAMVGHKKKRPGIDFAQGAYWWLKVSLMRELNWPDPRIHHNGGDTMLGEAVRQQGLPFHRMPFHCFGVKVNDAKRRGYAEAPAGCDNKGERI